MKSKLIYILAVFGSFYINTQAQSNPTTDESIEWINSKLAIYTVRPLILSRIELNENKELLIYDVRGFNDDNQFYSLLKIPLQDIYSIALRKEIEFWAIDIIPKEGESAFIQGYIESSGKSFSQVKNSIGEYMFLNVNPEPFVKIQITLSPNSADNEIGKRIIDALLNILKNEGIDLPEEMF